MHIKYKPLEMSAQIFLSNTKFTNQARLGQIMFKPIKYLMTTRSGDLCGVSMLAWLKPLSLVLRTQEFTSVLFYNDVNYVYFLYCQGQGNWLVCSIYFSGSF